jgi:hypothetical protein
VFSKKKRAERRMENHLVEMRGDKRETAEEKKSKTIMMMMMVIWRRKKGWACEEVTLSVYFIKLHDMMAYRREVTYILSLYNR